MRPTAPPSVSNVAVEEALHVLNASNKRGRIGVIVGVVIAAVGVAGTIALRSNNTSAPAVPQGSVQVVVASQDIPAGTQITADLLTLQAYPTGSVPATAYRSTTPLVSTFAAQNITSKQVILPAMVSSSSSAGNPGNANPAGGSQIVLTKGNVAIAMTVDPQIAVGYYIQPGDHVDFILNVAPGTVKYGFQDVIILKVGGAGAQATNQGGTTATSPRQDNLIVVELPRRQGEELAAMEAASGSPVTISRLVLRPQTEWGKGYLDSGQDQPFSTTPADPAMGPSTLTSVFGH